MARPFLSLALSFATAIAVSMPIAAQRTRTVEGGVFLQRAAFDEQTTLAFGTHPGIGGHVGVYVWPNLVVEAGAAYVRTRTSSSTGGTASSIPLRVRAVYNVPVTEDFYPMVGLGLVRHSYSGSVEASDIGISPLVGFKTYLRERIAFRSDLHLDLGNHVNWGLSAGMSVDFGPGRYSDSDGDLVRDRLDRCPDTPPGVAVYPDGCRVDSDSDGVFDELDACPDTPIGATVDANGCRVDEDGDGVFDDDDRCWNTPSGVSVDGVGCPLDSDLDRVPDSLDRCADTPIGVRVDGFGCRIDTDMDGVFDEDDRCPDTAPGTEVDPFGCQLLFAEEETVIVLEGVTFETASAELTPEAQDVLAGIAEALVANPGIHVRVNGHTDSTGSRAYNLTLSQNRADSVVSYLESHGVAVERMAAEGFGPDQPVATNETPEGRQQNRRVELERVN